MDSNTESTEVDPNFKPEEVPEESSEEQTAKSVENIGENDVDDMTVGDSVVQTSGDKSSSEVIGIDQTGANDGNTNKEDVEIVEIEEKVIIETLDEAKSAEDSPIQVQETLDSSDKNTNESKVEGISMPSGSPELKTEEGKPSEEREKQDEWTDLLGNGLLKKKVIKAGKQDSSKPTAGQDVCIRCEGRVPGGDKVDIKEKLKFIIGDGDVITAIDLCVPTMLENEICELITAPRFAYGSLGREDEDEGDVPPDSEVTYTLELLSIENGPNMSNLTDEQRVELGDQKRERGNELFRREEYSLAIHSYTRALKYLGSSMSPMIVELKIKCWNNISASHLKAQDYAAARAACDSVLDVDPDNVKALFRKGKVLHAEGEFEEAIELLKRANTLDPESKLIKRELYIVRQKCGESKKKERSMYQRMVSGLNDDNASSESNKTFFTWPVLLGITGIALGGVMAAFFFKRH